MQARVEGQRRALQRFDAHGASDISNTHQLLGLVDREGTEGSHQGSAVGQRQAFLGFQFHDGDAGPCHCYPAREHLSLVPGLALADHYQRHVGQRGQVAGCAQRALHRNDGVYAAVDHLRQAVDDLQANAGMSFEEVLHPGGHQSARRVHRQGWPDAGRMRQDDVALQLFDLFGGDDAVFEVAKPGCNAVDDFVVLDKLINRPAGAVDALDRTRFEADGQVAGCLPGVGNSF